jgi:hypothetical protein
VKKAPNPKTVLVATSNKRLRLDHHSTFSEKNTSLKIRHRSNKEARRNVDGIKRPQFSGLLDTPMHLPLTEGVKSLDEIKPSGQLLAINRNKFSGPGREKPSVPDRTFNFIIAGHANRMVAKCAKFKFSRSLTHASLFRWLGCDKIHV